MAEKKKYLSPSQLDMLAKCGLQYEFRYINGIKYPPGVAMVIGTATHKSIEKNLRSKMDTKSLLSDDEVANIASESLKATWAGEEPELSEEEKSAGPKTIKGEAIDTAVDLAKLHHKKLAPKIEPIHVEREVYLELKGFPMDMKGYIDIQEENLIRDTKTRARSPAKGEATESLQLQFYSLARTVLDQKPPAEVVLDVLVKKKEPEIAQDYAQFDETDHKRVLLRVQKAYETIKAGTFNPAPSGAWYCSARFCGYWNRCDFGAKHKVQG